MLSRKSLLAALATASVAVLVSRFTPAQTDKGKAAATPPAGTPVPAAMLTGSGSCAGRACHGGSEPANKLIQQNEYSTWLAHDRHASAYKALLSDRGRRIAINLRTVAHEDARCLTCHANPLLAAADLPQEFVPLRAEGVSCEACHGPANGPHPWLAAHTTESWKKETDRSTQFARHQMTYIADPEVQARTCAGCHVGAPADASSPVVRDCNHDLMAAGHPRLTFELSVYLINEPPHWRADQYKDDPARQARTWAVGQAAAARSSLQLLAHRAESAMAHAPWPEFAETDCFTCHADLREKSWRQRGAYYKGRTPGSLPYSRWYWTMLPTLAPLAGSQAQEVGAVFHALEAAMSKPAPAPKRISEAVAKALPLLDRLVNSLKSTSIDAGKVQAMLAKMKDRKSAAATMRWEEAEQLALALGALHEVDLAFRKQSRDEKTDKLLADLFQALSYPPHYESPHTFRRGEALEKALDGLLASP